MSSGNAAVGPASGVPVERRFIRLAEGLMHLRHAGDAQAGKPPVWLMHASPSSSVSLQPLISRLAAECRVIAPDTPGYGDSVALAASQPSLLDYADAHRRMLDALGVDRTVLYGHHTGAHIAVELAILMPDRIAGIVLEGLLWLEGPEREDFMRHYAPPMLPDAWGTQVFQSLQWLRDQAWFFPHFRRDAEHNLGMGALPPDVLHMLMLDMLKAGSGYHLAYQAVFTHRLEERLRLVRTPALLLTAQHDPTAPAMARAREHITGARACRIEEGGSVDGLTQRVRAIIEFAVSPDA